MRKYTYENMTTIWVSKETKAKLEEIKKEVEEKLKFPVDIERVIIELIDAYQANKRKTVVQY